jgi:tetrapyrrole methylase family protein/MazG family protein
MERTQNFEDLVGLMDRLRGEEGCPWDREQTYLTLRCYLLEECYEVVDALDRTDASALCEELGDLLFQIVFLSRIAKEDGSFTIADVIGTISDKMIRRHPHVFGEVVAETSADVLKNWDEIKRDEKKALDAGSTPSLLAGIPRVLPALGKAQQLGRRAASVGFDWNDTAAVLEKVDEEFAELRDALAARNPEAVREEFGDLLFSLVMVARHEHLDAEAALEQTNRKFIQRFNWIENELKRRNILIEKAGLPLLEQLWAEAKTNG